MLGARATSAIDPLDVAPRKFVVHDHNLQNPVFAQKLGRPDPRGLY